MESNFDKTTERLAKTTVPFIGISLILISILLIVVTEFLHAQSFEKADAWLSIIHIGALSSISFIISFLVSTIMSASGKKDNSVLLFLFYTSFILGIMILFYISVKIFFETRALAL